MAEVRGGGQSAGGEGQNEAVAALRILAGPLSGSLAAHAGIRGQAALGKAEPRGEGPADQETGQVARLPAHHSGAGDEARVARALANSPRRAQDLGLLPLAG